MEIFYKIKTRLLDFFDNRFTSRAQFKGDVNRLDRDLSLNLNEASNVICENLFRYSSLTSKQVLLDYSSSVDGLDFNQVEANKITYGLNQIESREKLSFLKHLFLSYKNPFNLLLTVLALVSFITEDIKATIVISIMIIISTVIRLVQERRSNNAADKLKAMVSTKATVIRQEGCDEEDDDEHIKELERQLSIINANLVHQYEIPIAEIVPGDIIRLSAGDMIPADVRIIQAKDLFVSQAALTGESLPVEKFSLNTKKTNSVLELDNIGFMGSNIVTGSANAVVLYTGKNTFFGALANKVINNERTETSFSQGVNKVSWLLIYFMLIMSPVVFLINGLSTHMWRDALLFALSIAVGLTPEMLPMIVTSTLAKGAVTMSKQKVIVKHLDAIQNFGAMDVLCTDKTGTLTQDKICLERHTNIFGQDYDDVLEYAYLNSYYQTGLKNLLDIAVLERANFGDIPELIKKFTKIDEVPFDFKRRRMSVVVSNGEEHYLICKGAVEEMLSVCSYAMDQEQRLVLTPELLEKLRSVTAELNKEGLRVVAVAKKIFKDTARSIYNVNDEKELTLIGYVAFLDPPKETTKPALDALRRLGVKVKILTGDNELVTTKVCREVGLDLEGLLLGEEIDRLSDNELKILVNKTTVFAKLTPMHKERIVEVLRSNGHVVGFMGDGINDAPALRASDIGISVDSAVDISKEAADIILLEKSLMVLEKGVEEGRKTFANMLKYIKMTASSNFGNVFSVLVASAFIPFLPMLPVQLLLQNLIYDISQTVIPFDNVDREFVERPQAWDSNDLKRFMVFFGPISSLFDIITFLALWYIFEANSIAQQSLFQTGWFLEGLITQTLIVHMIRTRRIPFLQSSAALPMVIMTILAVSIGIIIAQSPIGYFIGMQVLPISYFAFLVLVVICYMILTQVMKGVYVRRFGWQ